MKRLQWESCTRSKAEGKNLASVLRTLTVQELCFWRDRFEHLQFVHELTILKAELGSRFPPQPREQLGLFY